MAKVLQDIGVPIMKKVKSRRDKPRLKRISPRSWEIVISVGLAAALTVINEIRNRMKSASKRENFTRIEKEIFDQEGNLRERTEKVTPKLTTFKDGTFPPNKIYTATIAAN